MPVVEALVIWRLVELMTPARRADFATFGWTIREAFAADDSRLELLLLLLAMP